MAGKAIHMPPQIFALSASREIRYVDDGSCLRLHI